MGTLFHFPYVQRRAVPPDVCFWLKNGMIHILAFEQGVPDIISQEGKNNLENIMETDIRLYFGEGEDAHKRVLRWLRLWAEISALSDVVADKAKPLQAEAEEVLAALFNRRHEVDVSNVRYNRLGLALMAARALERTIRSALSKP